MDELTRIAAQLEKLGERHEAGQRTIAQAVDSLQQRIGDVAQSQVRIEERQTASREALEAFKAAERVAHDAFGKRLDEEERARATADTAISTKVEAKVDGLTEKVDALTASSSAANSKLQAKVAWILGGAAVVSIIFGALVSFAIGTFKTPTPAPASAAPQAPVVYVVSGAPASSTPR